MGAIYNNNLLAEINEKIQIITEKNSSNFSMIKVEQEDHTLGNLVFLKLLEMESIMFCGYCKTHPLESNIIIKILTDGSLSPIKVLDNCLKDLYIELSSLQK
mmetsp:Transcript_16328/g.25360  ORF Transcript_16328/g.25360 Transcript_16328/m.25360 type:complete len:102 (-) Transcript_16328:4318-4623(-)